MMYKVIKAYGSNVHYVVGCPLCSCFNYISINVMKKHKYQKMQAFDIYAMIIDFLGIIIIDLFEKRVQTIAGWVSKFSTF